MPTAPEQPAGKKGTTRPDTRSRGKRMKDKGEEFELPELSCGQRLMDYLFDIGPTTPAGMSVGAISYSEIDAWVNRTGIRLTPWEARMLRTMSREYVAELHKADDPNCPSPLIGEGGERDEAEQQRALLAAAESMRADMRAMVDK